jgi:C4-type Zn-finger protein
MSDKVRQMTNKVMLTGKVTEFEKNTGKNKNKDNYITIEGSIQFGDHKAMTRKFKKYTDETKKNYEKITTWADNVKSVAKTSWEEATEVTMQCSFAPNDYVNSEEKLIESLNLDTAFINDIDGEYSATADIEGYIQSITPETKGEDQKETGRLRVTVITNDFFGNAIPIKNIIVPEDLKEAFEDGYEAGQTAKLYITFELHKGEEKPKKSGGIGVQRATDGKSYVEMILTGADPAIDEDDEQSFSKEAVRIAMSERKAMLQELKDKGYQGSNKEKSISSSGKSNSKPAPVDDEELPF